MHLCFVDESGTPAKPNRQWPCYFVIAGLIVPEERWRLMANRLHGLKTRFGYRGEPKWRFFAPHNDDDDNPMREWAQDTKNDFRRHVFSIITQDKSIKLVAGVCQAAAAYAIPGVAEQHDLYFGT